MLFMYGLCHIYSKFKYLFCNTQGLLAKNAGLFGGKDRHPRGTNDEQNAVDGASKIKPCPA